MTTNNVGYVFLYTIKSNRLIPSYFSSPFLSKAYPPPRGPKKSTSHSIHVFSLEFQTKASFYPPPIRCANLITLHLTTVCLSIATFRGFPCYYSLFSLFWQPEICRSCPPRTSGPFQLKYRGGFCILARSSRKFEWRDLAPGRIPIDSRLIFFFR